MRRITVWDLPTRIFHWALLCLVLAAFISAQIGGNAMPWHGRFGILIIGLLAFRLAWGVLGSTYARFATFVRGPQTIRAYLKGQWHGVGHNPLGALSVLGMLVVLLTQGVTGLFSNDDIAFKGPYAALLSPETSATITELHGANFVVLAILVGLHIAAIVFYTRVKKENLLKPMVQGFKDVEGDVPSATGGGWVALVVAIVIGFSAAWLASGALASKHVTAPAAATAATPNW
jgi:cytochrome b